MILPDPDILEAESLKEAKKEFEKAFIMRKLAENENNISQTADSIGIERSHLHKKIKSFGLKL
jgi:two-component system nitrogen regulation response regulator NtrX